MQIIPTSALPYYTMTCTLDGRPYIFTFTYSTREDRWYFDLADVDGNDIVLGTKVTPSTDLLGRFRYLASCPQGTIIASVNATSQDDTPPGLQELGVPSRVQLVYVTTTDLAQIAAGTFVP
jgi:hypothetical protein